MNLNDVLFAASLSAFATSVLLGGTDWAAWLLIAALIYCWSWV